MADYLNITGNDQEEFTSWSMMESSTMESFNLATATPIQKGELKAYHFIMPVLGAFVIILNGVVVISSGLILKRGKFRI